MGNEAEIIQSPCSALEKRKARRPCYLAVLPQSCCIGVSNCIVVRYLKRKRGLQTSNAYCNTPHNNEEEGEDEEDEAEEAVEAEGKEEESYSCNSINFELKLL